MALRFLCAFKYDCSLAFKGIVTYYQWRHTDLPKLLTPKAITVLVSQDEEKRIELGLHPNLWSRQVLSANPCGPSKTRA